eukprot:CAMPEP_0206259010 /NCGR_PEP_ID=MMETSP0047_2-20121206/26242_1 /ASSEMBLY_ACC=CAM_ASM_000192 /TAXON_ID=195065 /ORGANISM="Chroomonas mesostigmatica_cf, Strain CCMP1168" /LENGTH=160 /DNA_ID=CAMNT_0053685827 /DNA_START=367 /DNA_END=850 /DNA_ORIENTATION=-
MGAGKARTAGTQAAGRVRRELLHHLDRMRELLHCHLLDGGWFVRGAVACDGHCALVRLDLDQRAEGPREGELDALIFPHLDVLVVDALQHLIALKPVLLRVGPVRDVGYPHRPPLLIPHNGEPHCRLSYLRLGVLVLRRGRAPLGLVVVDILDLADLWAA